MDVIEALENRRSIRSYTGEKLSDNELQAILRAAQVAPVGMKRYDAVHLTVVEDAELLARIDSACARMLGNPEAHPLYGAPTLVVVSHRPTHGDKLGNVEYSNAAIVMHNMALAAVELGVGCCHIWGAIRAVVADPDLTAALSLPEGFTPCCAALLGHTQEVYTPRDNREELIGVDYLRG